MDWLEYTSQVSIEISTVCSMRHLHFECPLHYRREAIMPTRLVHKLITELGDNEFTGDISFSRYGEPMQDPRLWSFIAMARMVAPRASVVITTNGGFLTQSIVLELQGLGVARIHVSLYGSTLSQQEEKKTLDQINEKLTTLQLEVPLPVNGHAHKPLINIYHREKSKAHVTSCFQPLSDISIDVAGNMTLCCLDWKSQHCLGNISSASLEKVIDTSVVHATFEQLSNGTRLRGICQRCGSSREQR